MDAHFNFVTQTEWDSTAGAGWGSGCSVEPIQLPLLSPVDDAVGARVNAGRAPRRASPSMSCGLWTLLDATVDLINGFLLLRIHLQPKLLVNTATIASSP